jgi:hypothetical protein
MRRRPVLASTTLPRSQALQGDAARRKTGRHEEWSATHAHDDGMGAAALAAHKHHIQCPRRAAASGPDSGGGRQVKPPSGLVKALGIVAADPGTAVKSIGSARASQLELLQALARQRNVVGIGISEKTSHDETTGELSLCFYVRKKKPLSKLRGDQMVPPFVWPGGERAYVTDVKEIGSCHLHMATGHALRSGGSVSHIADHAGTVGAIVRRAGKLCILSNAHVLARSGKARVGDPIISPGTTDGGKLPADQVARLAAFVPIDKSGPNLVDAAVAEVLPAQLARVRTEIAGVTTPIRVVAPSIGMQVTKTGRTTQATVATVIDTHFRVILPYPNGLGLVRFASQVLCTAFADTGDSGALVTDVASGGVVGLHFAGNDNVSIFNPIGAVISALGISFAT